MASLRKESDIAPVIRRIVCPALLWVIPLAAQSPGAAPRVSVGGLFVTRYLYQLTDTANHLNAFDITRAYINVTGTLPGGLRTRVTMDLFTNTDSSRSYRIKFAYAAYTPGKTPVTFKLGIIQTPWLDWEEALWEYRMQGPMAMDRATYLSSSDFGAGLDGMWEREKVNAEIALVNGEGYNKGVGDQRKDVMGRASLRLRETSDSTRVGGLRVSVYGQYGKPTGGGERERSLVMVSYKSKRLTAAAEAAITRDTVTAPVSRPANGHVYSAFAVYHIPRSKAAIIGRVDVTHAQAGNTADRQTRAILGLSYQVHPNWRLLADWDCVGYQATPTPAQEATRSQALFQTMFTF